MTVAKSDSHEYKIIKMNGTYTVCYKQLYNAEWNAFTVPNDTKEGAVNRIKKLIEMDRITAMAESEGIEFEL